MAENDPNRQVIDFASARKSVKRANPKANGKVRNGGGGSGRPQWWRYVQYLLLLGIVAYMMQLCRSG